MNEIQYPNHDDNIIYRYTEWGPEWSCPATSLSFCSLEGMCSYPDICPFSVAGKWHKIQRFYNMDSLQENLVGITDKQTAMKNQ